MTLDARFREFARKYPRPSAHPAGATSNGDSTWDQDCGVFVYRFGQYVIGATAWVRANRVYGPTAWDVALASGALNPHAARCPAGGIHWWKSNTVSGRPGHVGVDLDGGGTRLAMATYAVISALAPALGYQSVSGYSRAKPAMKYAGWTDNYAGARYPLTAPAGTGPRPLPRTWKDAEMPKVIRRTTGDPEWSLIWPPLRGATPIERGYIVTVDPVRAKWWARNYDAGQGNEDAFERAEYVEAQEMARLDHEAWLRGQPVGGQGAVEIDYARIKADLAGLIPSVETIAGAVADEQWARQKE